MASAQQIAFEAVSALSDHMNDAGIFISDDFFVEEIASENDGRPYLFVQTTPDIQKEMPISINVLDANVEIIFKNIKNPEVKL